MVEVSSLIIWHIVIIVTRGSLVIHMSNRQLKQARYKEKNKPRIMQLTWPQVFANPLVNTRRSMPRLTHPALKTAGRLRTMVLVRGNREYMLTAPVSVVTLPFCLTVWPWDMHPHVCGISGCLCASPHPCLQSTSSPSWPHYVKIGNLGKR